MRKASILVAIITIFLFLLAALPGASAQQVLRQGNLAISPFIFDLQVEKGETRELSIDVTNLGDLPQQINLSINDFIPVGSEGDLSFLEADQKADPRYSLSSWIKISQQPRFRLEPKQTTQVKFIVAPPLDAEPGTHYGGLLFGVAATTGQEQGFEVAQKLGALVIAKLGKAEERGSISDFSLSKDWRSEGVLNFSTSFYNTGNAHVRPKGEIEIRNWYGKVVANGHVNRDAAIVLPETFRTFKNSINKPFFLGFYTAEVWLQFGNPKTEVREKLTFWYFPAKTVGLIVLVLGVLGGVGWFGIRRYNAWIVSRVKPDRATQSVKKPSKKPVKTSKK